MEWRCRPGSTAAALLCVLLLLQHLGSIEGQRPAISGTLRHALPNEQGPFISSREPAELTARRTQSLLDKKTYLGSNSDHTTDWAANNVCSRAYTILPRDLVRGNNNMATVDIGIVHDCIRTSHPGLWYAVIGTGQVLKASLVYEHSTNSNNQRSNKTTELAIFHESSTQIGCDALQCADSSVPFLTTDNVRSNNNNNNDDDNSDNNTVSSGWTTYWSTEVDETYYMYVYGMGSFEIILTEQNRPANDEPAGAIDLQIGDTLEGSTAYASLVKDMSVCSPDAANEDGDDDDNISSTVAVPGVWFTVEGAGSSVQAHLTTSVKGEISQISIYTDSFRCVTDVEHKEVFDPESPQWYPVSTAAVWDAAEGETYYIFVQGHDDPGVYDSGNFELAVYKQQRPSNDQCSASLQLQVGQTVMSSTSFAAMDDTVELCSLQGSFDKSPSAPGIWYETTGIEGLHSISVTSAYSSDVTLFVGDHCSSLICIDGSNNPAVGFADSHNISSLASVITWDAKKEEKYYLFVHGKDSKVGMFDLIMTKVTASDTSTTPTNESAETSAAATTASNLYSVEIDASLSFGLFPGTKLTRPSTEEVAGLMSQVNRFYSRTLRDHFGDGFVRFEAMLVDSTIDENSVLPIVISFATKVALFLDGTPPSSGTIFNFMAEANYQTFIGTYIWQSDPLGANLFYQTLRVEFGKSGSIATDSTLSDNGNTEEAVQRVDAKARMFFSFLPDAKLRTPTVVEVNGLVAQTKEFYSKVLFEEYDTFIRVGVTATGREYIAEADLPVVVSMDIHAFFAMPDANFSASDPPTATEMLTVMQEIKFANFIQNYVWESEPFATSLFYETRHISLSPGVSKTSPSLAPILVDSTSNAEGQLRKISVDVALYYSFHETASQTIREPGQSEVDGLMNATEKFLKEIFANELPEESGFADLHMNATTVEYNALSEFQVVVYTTVEVSVHQEDPDSTPSLYANQVLALLETTNMPDYVDYYVWFAEPLGSIFFSTDQAVLEPHDPMSVAAAVPSTATANNTPPIIPDGSATLLPVELGIAVKFSFFRDMSGRNENYRVATKDELDALTTQTQAYFTKVLQNNYEDLTQLDLSLITAEFAEDTSKPAVIAWKVSALFYVLDGNWATRTPEHIASALTSSDEEEYLHKYVWSADPMGSNLFFDAIAAQFEPPVVKETTSNNISSPTPSPSPTASSPTSEVLVQASILYGFLEDQEITRKPNVSEQETIAYQTTLFFNTLYRQSFGESFQKATVTIQDVALIEGDELPIIIAYGIICIFQDVDSVPSVKELYQVMEDANFEKYIELYVWKADSPANTMFYDTQQVVFQASIQGAGFSIR